jgi:hypothetical protein
LLTGLWWLAHHWHRNRYRRIAIGQLQQMRATIDLDPTERERVLVELSQLVKRVMLAAWPREQVAALNGESLLQFLDETGSTDRFTRGAGRMLATAAYRSIPDSEFTESQADELFFAIREWIQGHSVQRTGAAQGGDE